MSRTSCKSQPERMTEIAREDWPQSAVDAMRGSGILPERVWRSRDFFVTYFALAGKLPRLTVNRVQLGEDGRWRDGITWNDLQRIKSECGFGAVDAVEVYPANKDVVDKANMRHLWLVDAPFAWRREAGGDVIP